MAQRKRTAWLATKVDINGADNVQGIYKEMRKMFYEIGGAYRTVTHKNVLNVRRSLREANLIILRAAKAAAPVITPENYAKQNKHDQGVSLKDHMIARSGQGKKWFKQGIIARQLVTFKHPSNDDAQSPANYAAALEVGRDSFLQVVRKAPFGITGGETDFFLRKVGSMKARPFLIPSLENNASQAYNAFAQTLKRLHGNAMRKVAREAANRRKAKT